MTVKGLGKEPTMLLTDLPIVRSRDSLVFVVLSYLRRWQTEETIRFAKQAFRVEDIRIGKYDRLQNMTAIAVAAVHFVAVWLGGGLKLGILAHHALKASKCPFVIPNVRYYALVDGIRAFLEGSETPISGQEGPTTSRCTTHAA